MVTLSDKRIKGIMIGFIYPYLDYNMNYSKNESEFWVNDQESGECIILREWIDGKEPYKHTKY
jgi:hypothetical protein